jgi:hypothetical protein
MMLDLILTATAATVLAGAAGGSALWLYVRSPLFHSRPAPAPKTLI